MEKQKKGKGDKSVPILLGKAQIAFMDAYEKTKSPSILLAHQTFYKMVQKGEISSSEGHSILKSPTKFGSYLMVMERKSAESKEDEIKGILNIVRANTSARNAVVIGVTVGALFFLASNIAAPFVNKWLEPTVDRFFKKSSPTTTEPYRRPIKTNQNLPKKGLCCFTYS